MRFRAAFCFAAILLSLSSICFAQGEPNPVNATAAVLHAFETHDIVMFGEIHGNKQEYEWLRSLVATPEFADRVDDIVMEIGNSLYQKSVDRYVAGEDVPMEQVQKAWRNTVASIGPPSPVSGWLYQAVRESNLKRRGKHQMRVLCGDPYIDWEKVKGGGDIAPYLGNRDQWYAQVVRDEVLAKHHRALLIMGSAHFLRGPGPFSGKIEPELRRAGAKTYLIVFGTNTIGDYDDLDHRFDSWPTPVIVSLAGSWVGELPALPVINGGEGNNIIIFGPGPAGAPPEPLKLKDAADALLYLGPRDRLTEVNMPRAELEGTPYGKEIQRRLQIEGFSETLLDDKEEAPQFSRPEQGQALPIPGPVGAPLAPPPQAKSGSLPLPTPPKNMGAPPLPPRPPSQ